MWRELYSICPAKLRLKPLVTILIVCRDGVCPWFQKEGKLFHQLSENPILLIMDLLYIQPTFGSWVYSPPTHPSFWERERERERENPREGNGSGSYKQNPWNTYIGERRHQLIGINMLLWILGYWQRMVSSWLWVAGDNVKRFCSWSVDKSNGSNK
jgi:hypothetical protein